MLPSLVKTSRINWHFHWLPISPKSGKKAIHRLTRVKRARVHVSNETVRVTLALGGHFCKDECRYPEPIKTERAALHAEEAVDDRHNPLSLSLSLSEEDRIHGGGEQCMLTLLADKANNGQPKKERMEGRKEGNIISLSGGSRNSTFTYAASPFCACGSAIRKQIRDTPGDP